MLNIAICDDLQSDRTQMKKLTQSFCTAKDFKINIQSFISGETLLSYYSHKRTAFDIIFLDIYMTGINGIKSAETIRKFDSDCKIIFTTSSTEHSLESFKVFPFNYLVKPITKTVFNTVFERAVKEVGKEMQKSLTVKAGSHIQNILLKDIWFIESKAKSINVKTVGNKIITYRSKLDDIQSQIDDKRFLRCHKSFLVNMDHISSLEAYSFNLNNDQQIPITQRNFASIKKIFYEYILEKSNL